jgi:hypothetical protein
MLQHGTYPKLIDKLSKIPIKEVFIGLGFVIVATGNK